MKRTLIAVALISLLPVIGLTQPSASGSLTVVTTPPGAEVELEGEAELSGVAPVTFGYPLIGEYTVTVRKHGYENYRTRLVLDPSQPQQLSVDLSPKTGGKAALRSALIPGWGQFYTEQKTKSFLFGAAFVGAVIAFVDVNDKFDTKQNEYLRRLGLYEDVQSGGGTFDDLSSKYQAMVLARQEAYDAENDRRVAIAAVAGIWGLNVLDALLFTPDERGTFSVKGLSVTPTTDNSGVGVNLSLAF